MQRDPSYTPAAGLTVAFSEEGAALALAAIEGTIFALHNHIASEVEKPGTYEGGAARLVADLRKAENAAKDIRGAFYAKHGYKFRIPKGDDI